MISERLRRQRRLRRKREIEQATRYRPSIVFTRFEFSLEAWTDEVAEEYFRFTKREIYDMLEQFNLQSIVYPARCICSAELALCITLSRLSSPSRYKDRFHQFGKSRSFQSNIFNAVICYLDSKYKVKLRWDERRLTLNTLRSYNNGIKYIGGPDGVWGFVDGTLRTICKPEENQKVFYTGYKKAHALKWQGIMTPDGLISSLFVPVEGKLGDWVVWKMSGIEDILRMVYQRLSPAERYYIYGDPAYSLSYSVMCAYKASAARPLTLGQKLHNAAMSSYRIAVEHGFGKVVNLWGFVAYKNGMRIGKSPVGAYYNVAVLLTNIHTCFRGSQVTSQFNVAPPAFRDYIIL
ncbi:hypothetical protein P167DRAFT_490514 [Morchella conica CCBAS932]|uniref:DDE Tnp4 domain-containing protein n=1 Tax=Morchella conica CCBAS932 TaxID=1392247 RepID=A0A3N4KJK9_9PEZI|nr:hypothetical protein P167DRAFT_490514 [Morchella conica CCBAS932]